MSSSSDRLVIREGEYVPPEPQTPVELQCAVMGAKMIASLAGYGVWRLFGGKKEDYPFVVEIL